MMADLDHFKELNDTHGHETGDRALRVFAETLRGTCAPRTSCAVRREEFAAVLPACGIEDARAAIEQVRLHLAGALGRAGMPHCTASFGIVEARAGDDLAATITRADAALFQAKREGRDRIVVHGEQGETVSADTGRARTGNGAAANLGAPCACVDVLCGSRTQGAQRSTCLTDRSGEISALIRRIAGECFLFAGS